MYRAIEENKIVIHGGLRVISVVELLVIFIFFSMLLYFPKISLITIHYFYNTKLALFWRDEIALNWGELD